ncbi:MAG TPA: hypothetical protein VLA37_13640 [Sphingomonadaceae bacterium]|nr:hypothetical protein [Sphingomonadaceae bacterium]
MNAMSQPFLAQHYPGEAGSAELKWAVLGNAAGIVAQLAGVEPAGQHAFPEAIFAATGWRRELAEKSLDDLVAVLEPGIAALIAVNARNADARPAAQALWREFEASRDALLALAPVGANGAASKNG